MTWGSRGYYYYYCLSSPASIVVRWRRWYSFAGRSSIDDLRPILDLKSIMANKDYHVTNAKNRRSPIDFVALETAYLSYRKIAEQVMQLRRQRNLLAHNYNREKSENEASIHLNEAVTLRDQIDESTKQLKDVESILYRSLRLLPNYTHRDTPVGDYKACRVVRQFGASLASSGERIDHVKLGKSLGILDFEAGARVAGSSFFFLKGKGALLENAIIQYALKKAIEAGFVPILPPDIAYGKYVRACGFLPRGANEEKVSPYETEELPAYVVEEGDVPPLNRVDGPTKVLTATAEIPLAAYYSNHILASNPQEGDKLPIKWVAISHCFRPETGHYGLETRGLYRVHQFSKVELFVIKDDHLATSDETLQDLVCLQESILGGLEIPCRVLEMSTEELGASAYQKYDIECYLPARGDWGELTSASNCTDYQARRLRIRYRPSAIDNSNGGANGDVRFVHTLNATAAAIPRLIQAILEHHQTPNGTVRIPTALQPFMLDNSQEIKLDLL